MHRRTVLGAGAAVSGLAGGATLVRSRAESSGPGEPADPHREMALSRRPIMEGTDRETTVFELEGPETGPTAVVVGGVHGGETSGYRAAEEVIGWGIERGTLVVIPWAEIVALERNERGGPDGDLNRQFPAGREPTTELARALWAEVERSDPDVVLDLHRSRGIYGTHHRWVGQAIFPTAAGDAPADAGAVIEHMNDEHVPRTMVAHRFSMGNTLTGEGPLLIHKVGGDLDRAGFLVELTDFLLDPGTQVRWTLEITERLLERYGMARIA
ncbi:succinylglutamate desuccinylase/aspartoacylase domain-containing protein [Saliphagus infecundisoli]|uniref:Succinylglutamate desuccinylase/aspartoacylase family protein n=1 Tax=Saliphagus infecundisoli TaxID=1849069 RepID=A0ABD5QBV4_9EURY|nr:succinylglutamate desuccinylase/aspartoacylase family protein [Saliphagus infecundisoli]